MFHWRKISYFNFTYINICYTHVITIRKFGLKWTWQLTKTTTKTKSDTEQWNWSSCTKLALSVSSTHGLIAQLVRALEPNSLVVGSNPTQANFLQLLERIFRWWIRYIYHIWIIYCFQVFADKVFKFFKMIVKCNLEV